MAMPEFYRLIWRVQSLAGAMSEWQWSTRIFGAASWEDQDMLSSLETKSLGRHLR